MKGVISNLNEITRFAQQDCFRHLKLVLNLVKPYYRSALLSMNQLYDDVKEDSSLKEKD